MMKNQVLTNQTMGEYQLISLQLSYSTADIEKSVFYESEYTPIRIGQPFGEAKMMVIHGDVFTLEEGSILQPSTPLTEKSGLFKIVKLAEESVPY